MKARPVKVWYISAEVAILLYQIGVIPQIILTQTELVVTSLSRLLERLVALIRLVMTPPVKEPKTSPKPTSPLSLPQPLLGLREAMWSGFSTELLVKEPRIG
jgi:hypothetical protein